jgi:urate oxidase
MTFTLGDNRYGKAETRLVRVDRGDDRHEIIDLNVSTSLAGDLDATHLTGDNAGVLPTDTQKNTVYAFARDGVGEPEEFGLRLARHFVETAPTITKARVHLEMYRWERLTLGYPENPRPAPHSFARAAGTRTATVTYDGTTAWVVSGVEDVTLLNTTDSEFHGFQKDRYTTLAETTDRILATAVSARWRHGGDEADWAVSFRRGHMHLLEAFADTHSLSLQQTLYAMGERVLKHDDALVEVRLALPNKHHFLVDLSPFQLDNPGEVFHAADRPYGLIEGTVLRDGAPEPGLAWW